MARPASCHASTRPAHAAQIAGRQRVDDGQRVRRRVRSVAACAACVRRACRVCRRLCAQPVDDERLQPAAEDAAEIALAASRTASRNMLIMTFIVRCRRLVATADHYNASMRLRQLNVGCFGGGTGLPSLLGGLKTQSVAAR